MAEAVTENPENGHDDQLDRPAPGAAPSVPSVPSPYRAMVTAAVLSLVWIAGCTAYFLTVPGAAPASRSPVSGFANAVAVILPLVLLWFTAAAAQRVSQVRAETERLKIALASLRKTYLALQQTQSTKITPAGTSAPPPSDSFVAFASRRASQATSAPPVQPASTPPPVDDPVQAQLPLMSPALTSDGPVSVDDFISAMNFPKTADDEAGFDALRRALADPYVNRLIQASQDMLTLLSQDGIYMDDLSPDIARPELWRRFAEGERGRAVAMLGGVRDRSSLALSAQRMREDHIFRDTAHHFLRQYDKTFAAFADTATDDEILRLTNTRTARAFMLLGRVAGIFA